MKFICPRCRGGNLRIIEHFEAEDVIEVQDGEVVNRRPGEGSSLGRFSAKCDCGHTWHPRHSTGKRAVEAAQEL